MPKRCPLGCIFTRTIRGFLALSRSCCFSAAFTECQGAVQCNAPGVTTTGSPLWLLVAHAGDMLWFVHLGSHVIRRARLVYMLWFVLMGSHVIREAGASCLSPTIRVRLYTGRCWWSTVMGQHI